MVHIKKGELTQEEKELLEVIGKGMSVGLCSGSCKPGRGKWLGPRGAPGPDDFLLRFCEIGSLGSEEKRFSLWSGTRCRGEGMGGRSIAGTGMEVCRGASSKSAFGNVQISTAHLRL